MTTVSRRNTAESPSGGLSDRAPSIWQLGLAVGEAGDCVAIAGVRLGSGSVAGVGVSVFGETAGWERANWFARPGQEREYRYSWGPQNWFDNAREEHLAVRNNVGLVDVSTLGKITVQGPDAAAFLDRVYVNAFGSLAVGRARDAGLPAEEGAEVCLAGQFLGQRLAALHFVGHRSTD